MPRVQKNRLISPPTPEDPHGAAAPPDDSDAGLDLAAGGTPSVRHSAATIRRFREHAPAGPGVYRMIAADGEVLYVGKTFLAGPRWVYPMNGRARFQKLTSLKP